MTQCLGVSYVAGMYSDDIWEEHMTQLCPVFAAKSQFDKNLSKSAVYKSNVIYLGH